MAILNSRLHTDAASISTILRGAPQQVLEQMQRLIEQGDEDSATSTASEPTTAEPTAAPAANDHDDSLKDGEAGGGDATNDDDDEEEDADKALREKGKKKPGDA